MKSLFAVLFLLSFCLPSPLRASDDPPAGIDPAALPAAIRACDGWTLSDEPEIAAGDDLFLLIDGGAEIYHEYGFTQAVYQTCTAPDGRSINLELYEMESPAAAYGIYTFKTGVGGTPVAVGGEGWLESYYLNIWKGRFLITAIALDTAGDASADLITISRAIEAVLPGDSVKPPLVSILHDAMDITYLRGNLALFNWYQFDAEDIFGLREGVAGIYENHSALLIRYDTDSDADRWFENAKSHLRSSDRFDGFVEENARFEITDRKHTLLTCVCRDRWIVVLLAAGSREVNPDIETILKRAATVEAEAPQRSPGIRYQENGGQTRPHPDRRGGPRAQDPTRK